MFAGACRDSLTNPIAAQHLRKIPPLPLVERYYECVLKPYDAFFNALGLSLGNADIYTKWGFGKFLIFFISFLYLCRGFDPKLHTFTRNEGEWGFENGMAVVVIPPDETDRK